MGRYRNAGFGNGTNGQPQTSLEQSEYEQTVKEIEQERLLQELDKNGTKYDKDNMLFISKDKTGQVVWLEKGNKAVGLEHIIDRHAEDYKKALNISKVEIPGYLKKVVSEGKVLSNKIVVHNGKQGYTRIYDYGGKYYIISGIGTNGFIVSAYPVGKE